VRVPPERRDALRDHLAARGVDTGIHWQPGHSFSLLRDSRRGDLSVTDRAGSEILTLPLHSDPAPGTVERVVAGVASFFDG
jgi:dTDP-4-amino-4,6-dideoxygalactose transaminase